MSMAKRAREWLGAQDGPRTSRQIADAIGGNAVNVQWAVGCMLRDGLLRRVRAAKPCTYEVAREAAAPDVCLRMAQEARMAKATSRRVERMEERRAAAEARRIERERTSAARKREREANRAQYERERRMKRVAVSARRLEALAAQPVVNAPKPRAQTVEEFLAQGGRIERLEPHVMKAVA